jgi:hypothetical protein
MLNFDKDQNFKGDLNFIFIYFKNDFRNTNLKTMLHNLRVDLTDLRPILDHPHKKPIT